MPVVRRIVIDEFIVVSFSINTRAAMLSPTLDAWSHMSFPRGRAIRVSPLLSFTRVGFSFPNHTRIRSISSITGVPIVITVLYKNWIMKRLRSPQEVSWRQVGLVCV